MFCMGAFEAIRECIHDLCDVMVDDVLHANVSGLIFVVGGYALDSALALHAPTIPAHLAVKVAMGSAAILGTGGFLLCQSVLICFEPIFAKSAESHIMLCATTLRVYVLTSLVIPLVSVSLVVPVMKPLMLLDSFGLAWSAIALCRLVHSEVPFLVRFARDASRREPGSLRCRYLQWLCRICPAGSAAPALVGEAGARISVGFSLVLLMYLGANI